ncbi:MAG: GAF domain-containing protein [Chloroflexi bacterium]|nr:GAF domain-containing protein [Chloroflexota bacterium]
MLNSATGMVVVFFAYGLAFFLMGFAILGEAYRAERGRLTTNLFFLAAFGLIHSTVEWSDMFRLIFAQSDLWWADRGLALLRSALLPISLIPLLLFGIRTLSDALDTSARLWLLLPALTVAWLLTASLPLIAPGAVGWEQVEFAKWESWQEAWAKYLMYFPGSLLAALALAAQRRVFLALGLSDIAGFATLGALGFVLNAIVAGLIVPPASFPPASWLNSAQFSQWFGFPPQLLRALAATVVAFAVVQMLRFSELTRQRRLEEAHQQAMRFEEEARRQVEQWSRTLERAVRERTEQLDALARINAELSAQLDLSQLLGLIVEKARQLLRVDVANLSLINEAGELWVRSVIGERTAAFRSGRLAVGHGVTGKAVALGQPVIVADYANDPGITHELDALMEAEELRSHLAVPLRMGTRMLGAIFVATRTPRQFESQDVELLSHLAHQAAVALENARLYQEVQDFATLKERERLAREMHDSLAQALGCLRLEASRADQLLRMGDSEGARRALAEMDRVAETAYADVREAILGLKSAVLSNRGLLQAIKDYLHAFSLQSDVQCELIDGLEGFADLPPRVEVQVLRIVQEALTNVRKHARASRVAVIFHHGREEAQITVQDDGRGFDPEALTQQGTLQFGLATMKERGESIGGALEVHSAPGAGTRVTLHIPQTVIKEVMSHGSY